MLPQRALLDPLRRFKHHAIRKWAERNAVSGWTSPREQEYFRKYARSEYTGQGEIVDLGCMLGATTLQLATGLARNRQVQRRRSRIHCYDLFLWESAMEILPGQFKRNYKAGDSFLDAFKARVSGYAEHIEIYPGDLMQIGWTNAPIEFLLVDANKTWELCAFIFTAFFPSLLVGKALVLEQDFKHYYTPWIHLLHYRLRNYFDHRDLKGTCSVVFRLVKPIDTSIKMVDLMGASVEELEEAYAHSLSLIGEGKGWEQANILASKVMFYLHQDRAEEARDLFERLVRDGYTLHSDLAICQQLLKERGTDAEVRS